MGTLRREKGKNQLLNLYETSYAGDLVIGTCNDGCLVKLGYDGLLVQNEETQAVLFQAKRILQTALCPKDGLCRTRLEDLDHPEQQLVVDIMPLGWEILYKDTRLPVSAFVSQLEVQVSSLEEYSFAVLEVLKHLLHASLETGNPIVWC